MLDSRTTLQEPIHWVWLPNNAPLRGFKDWFAVDKEHYKVSEDPLNPSNVDDDLLPPLCGSLGNLESTRKDVFPLKRDDYVWEHLFQSFKNSSLPFEAQKTLSSLTSTAKHLTRDLNDGFGHETSIPRGGLNANNTLTTSTYILKSLTSSEPFKSFKWKTAFMQSVTMRYDKPDRLMPTIGFTDPLGWWKLKDEAAKLEKNNERVFLSHLTSSTHHGFGIPTDEEYVSLAGDTDHDLSYYLNTVGYVDRYAEPSLPIPIYMSQLAMSHPKLPYISIDDPVSSIQNLPTVLDLLIETKSLLLSEAGAAHDTVRNYESQSLLRPLQKLPKTTGRVGWPFTGCSPANWRLIAPVFGNYEWRFTDLETDPHGQAPLLSYDYKANLQSVEAKFGSDAAMWAEEVAAVTQWWTDENYKRWRYTA
ncbi:alkaline-phosphatase-like protein [Trichoderma sp. SZMC 28015]